MPFDSGSRRLSESSQPVLATSAQVRPWSRNAGAMKPLADPRNCCVRPGEPNAATHGDSAPMNAPLVTDLAQGPTLGVQVGCTLNIHRATVTSLSRIVSGLGKELAGRQFVRHLPNRPADGGKGSLIRPPIQCRKASLGGSLTGSASC